MTRPGDTVRDEEPLGSQLIHALKDCTAERDRLLKMNDSLNADLDRTEVAWQKAKAERNRLAFELDAEKHNHRKDNEYLIAERDRLREHIQRLTEELDVYLSEPCPDCGIPKIWCRRVTSNPDHCWRWDYEQFETLMMAAEAENRRLTEGLREAETGFNDISLILEAENEGYQERAYRRAVEEWRHIRALLAESPGDAARVPEVPAGEPETHEQRLAGYRARKLERLYGDEPDEGGEA